VVSLSSSAYLKKGLTIRKLVLLIMVMAVLVACAAALAQPLETMPGRPSKMPIPTPVLSVDTTYPSFCNERQIAAAG
jgi:hypothetical protein